MSVADKMERLARPCQFVIVFVLGAPGAGKGTLCSHLAQKYNFTHYSLGDGLRSWMCEHRSEPLALEIQDKLDNQGFLAPEDLNPFITQEIKDAIYQNSQGILIDGFPRSKEQLQAFDHWPLQDKLPFASDGEFCAKPNVALSFKASKENARARYLRRARDSNDSKEKFERRFAEYEDETLAVEHVYRQRGILMEVDVNGSREENVKKLTTELSNNKLWQSVIVEGRT